jgi:hypothetical protein
MKTTSGNGIETARQRIASAFETVHDSLAAELLKTKAERDVEVEVVMEKPRKVVPLAQQAAPLLASIGSVPVFRKKDVRCHEISEVFQGNVMDLFAEAEAALGFKEEPTVATLKTNIATKKRRFHP